MQLDTLIIGWFETIFMVAFGFSVLGIPWKQIIYRISSCALCISLLTGTLKNEIHPLLYILVLALTLSLFLNMLANTNFGYTLIAVLIGMISYLLVEASLFSVIPFLAINRFPVVTWFVLSLAIILFEIIYSKSHKIKINICHKINKTKWTMALFFVTICCFFVFYSFSYTVKGNQFLLAITFLTLLIIAGYSLFQKYESDILHLKSSFSKQFNNDVHSYTDLLTTQRYLTIQNFLEIRMLLETGQIYNSINLLDKLIDEQSEFSDVSMVQSNTIARIMSAYKLLVHKKGSELVYDLQDDLSDLPCSTYEMTNLVKDLIQFITDLPLQNSNLDSIIYFTTKRNKQGIVIELFKTSHTNIREIHTTENIHAVGSIPGNIQSIVDKYGGQILFKTPQNSILIEVVLPTMCKKGDLYESTFT